jgi:glycosyltransferase involved in cell wall biosynthesis
MQICLNLIVKNESQVIRRCLEATLDLVNCVSISDTGSTDGTLGVIQEFCARHRLPLDLHQIEFKDFSQARNEALALCVSSSMVFDYVLLIDADMVIHGERPGCLAESAYDVRIVDRLRSYKRVQLLQRSAKAAYRGVTHEYLAIDGGESRGSIDEFWIEDLGDGGAKDNKYERDVHLLLQGLAEEPSNVRYMFYLANTFRDMRRYDEAIAWYAKRIAAEGWEEEHWHSLYQTAICHLRAGRVAEFVHGCWEAYDFRPTRAEPLYWLARHYRQAGMYEACMAVCQIGRAIAYPTNDILFIEDYVYRQGFLEEEATSGYYCTGTEHRRRGKEACTCLEQQTRDPEVKAWVLRTGQYYTPAQPPTTLPGLCPGTRANRITVAPAHLGWSLFNPSVLYVDGVLWCLVRSSNYQHEHGHYLIPEADGGVIRTANLLVRLHEDGTVISRSLLTGPDYDKTDFPVDGLEDCRLYQKADGNLGVSATVRNAAPLDGHCRICLATIDLLAGALTDLQVLDGPLPSQHEKNWMPILGRPGHWLYATLIDNRAIVAVPEDIGDRTIVRLANLEGMTPLTPDLRGGSQLVPVDGGWLALVHEVTSGLGRYRCYLHRWVWFDDNLRLRRWSPQFQFFLNSEVEFAAGLALIGDCLFASIGLEDREAWLIETPVAEVLAILAEV